MVRSGRSYGRLFVGDSDIDDTIRRLCAYAEAGADVSTHRTCRTGPPPAQSSELSPPSRSTSSSASRCGFAQLQTIGVRRISLGVDPHTHVLAATQAAAVKLAKADLTALASNLDFGHIIDLIKG